ncbi:MAG: hypothetical protein ACKVY0_04840 [Prosthecobacter sp.]|uniref:hypothetical protein n=1 Tax=Prosthecobacter sp. TaxID=1965333 RepID=UPI0038FDC80E
MRAISKSFLLMVVLLVGAELVGRLLFARTLSGRFDYGYDATAGFVENADGTVDLVRAGGRKFFPQSFALQREPDMARVMVVGDSVARGRDVASSYAGKLGAMLRESGMKAESFNMGLPGYGARRKQLVVQQALKYHPSLVVLHVNSSNEFEDEREWRRREEFRSPHPKNWLMKSVVIRRLFEVRTEKIFWELLPQEVRLQGAVSDADAEINASMNAALLAQWHDLVRDQTALSVEMAKQAGVPILLVLQANEVPRTDGHSMADDQGQYEWAAKLAGPGVEIIGMKDVFKGLDAATLYVDGSHMKAAGHELLARAIFERLKAGFAAPTAQP